MKNLMIPKTLFQIAPIKGGEKLPKGYNVPQIVFPMGAAPCFVTKMSKEQLKEANRLALDRFTNLKTI